jgi:hypothetical protein
VLLLRALLHYNARPVVPHPPRYARELQQEQKHVRGA